MSVPGNKMAIQGFEALVQAINRLTPTTGLYPILPIEQIAGVTPTDDSYPYLHIKRYGAAVNDSTNDYTAVSNAVLVAYTAGGGRVFGWDGGTAKLNSELILLDDVIIDGDHGAIHFALSGNNEVGIHMRSRSQLLNVDVTVTSSGSPGSQGSIHSGILIGNLYSLGGTVASPAAGSTVTGCVIRNVKSSTDKAAGGTGLGIIGDVSNILIENFEVPDSSLMLYGVSMDWGYLGTLDSASDSGIAAGKTAFLANTMNTTHPTQITMRNVKIGALTATGSHGLRISGCDNIKGENFKVAKTTYAAFFHTAGDAGYEFALTAVKPRAHKNIEINGFDVADANVGWGAYIDGYADNVASAVTNVAYTPLLPAIAPVGIVIRQLRTQSESGASAIPGFRVQNVASGVVLMDCEATKHTNGILGETGSDGVHVIRGRYYANRNDGILIHHSSDLPEDWLLEGVRADGNATATSTEAGIYAQACRRVTIRKCVLGISGEATQLYGVHCLSTTVDLSVIDNHVLGLKSSGIAYAMASSTNYGSLKAFRDNTSAAPTHYAGIDIIPEQQTIGADGLVRGKYRTARATLNSGVTPTAGTWRLGDIIFYSDPITADYIGSVCTSAGSQGTWKKFGATT